MTTGTWTAACAVALLLACCPLVFAEGRALLQTQVPEQGPQLLRSMHCFQVQEPMFLASSYWQPASDFGGADLDIAHVAVPATTPGTVLSSACEAVQDHLEFVFTVPADCPLEVKMYFAEADASAARMVAIYANGDLKLDNYDITKAGPGGDTVVLALQSSPTGLLDLAILPKEEGVKPLINGIQIYSQGPCERDATRTADTTAETSSDVEESNLVYRLACSSMSANPEVISTDLNTAQSKFMSEQQQLIGKITDPSAATALFEQLCVPATDADHVVLNLPLDAGITYEVMLYFKMVSQSSAPQNILVTANGEDVFPEDREVYTAGSGDAPTYLYKRFQARVEEGSADGMSIVVTALSGFPPLSGLEVFKVVTKEGALGKTLLDAPDGSLLVHCGSSLSTQTPAGNILYAGTEAFSAEGLLPNSVDSAVAASVPEHQDLVDAGAFNTNCYTADTGSIISTFRVQPGQAYKVTLYWAELKHDAAGLRVMDVAVDGVVKAPNVDVFAQAGKGKTYALTVDAMPTGDFMTVTITAKAGTPMVNVIGVEGPGVDVAAADKPLERSATGRVVATACGAAGPAWSPIGLYTGAGFAKFTSKQALPDVPREQQGLYATHCYPKDGVPGLAMQFSVMPGREYRVVLHFAEVFFTKVGERVFNVNVNGLPQISNLDIVKEVGPLKPYVTEFVVIPDGSTLALDFVGVTQNPLVNGVEVFLRKPKVMAFQLTGANAPASAPAAALPVGTGEQICIPASNFNTPQSPLSFAPSAVDFGAIDPESVSGNFQPVRVTNGGAPQTITSITCEALAPGQVVADFIIQFDQTPIKCGADKVTVPVDPPFQISGAGAQREIMALFVPKQLSDAAAKVVFSSDTGDLGDIILSGLGGDPYSKPHTLHPVVTGNAVFTAPQTEGGATVLLDGSTSHTHEPNGQIVSTVWTDIASNAVAGKDTVLNCYLPFGTYTMSFTIQDQTMEALAASSTFVVAPEDAVPGTLIEVYPGAAALASLPTYPSKAFVSAQAFATDASTLGTGAMAVRLQGGIYHAGGDAAFTFDGFKPTAVLLSIGGAPQASTSITGMPEGNYDIDLRVMMPAASTMRVYLNGKPISSSLVDISAHAPIINELSTDSATRPGTSGLLKGFMLRAPGAVFIGDVKAEITAQTTDSISFTYPADMPAGDYSITVARDGVVSNAVPVSLQTTAGADGGQGGPFDTQASFAQKFVEIKKPSRVVFCHGKIYVSQAYDGGIYEITPDGNYDVVSQRVVVTLPKPYTSILGLACDPRDNDANFKLYFSHSHIFAQDGKLPNKAAPYVGKVSYIQPNVAGAKVVPVLSNIAVSNADHAVNALDFDHQGRLLVAVGSNTNAGMPGKLGYLPENPTAATILMANIKAPGFNGDLSYKFLASAPTNVKSEDPMDQRYGEWVELATTTVAHYAVGTRNPFGLKVGQKGNVMVTVNGPNVPFGLEMTGLDSDGMPTTAKDPESGDALYLDLKQDCYSGSPNVARCRAGATRECKFTSLEKIPAGTPGICKPDAMLPSSIGQPMEYNSYAFGGLYYGRIFIPSYKKHTIRYNPEDGKLVNDKEDPLYPPSPGIDAAHAPGGVHLITDLDSSKLLINYPVDNVLAANGNPSVFDILPNKALMQQSGANTFVIGGANFDKITGPISVTFGGVPSPDAAVQDAKTIVGSIPSNPQGTCATTITITAGATTLSLPGIFCYLAK